MPRVHAARARAFDGWLELYSIFVWTPLPSLRHHHVIEETARVLLVLLQLRVAQHDGVGQACMASRALSTSRGVSMSSVKGGLLVVDVEMGEHPVVDVEGGLPRSDSDAVHDVQASPHGDGAQSHERFESKLMLGGGIRDVGGALESLESVTTCWSTEPSSE